MKKRSVIIAALCCMLACSSLAACQSETVNNSDSTSERTSSQGEQTADASVITEYTDEVFAMDTYMTLTAYGENAETAVKAGIEEIQRLDALWSTGDENSEIAVINQNSGGSMSEETAYLVERALELYESTEGAFDISIYPVMDLWGFTTGNFAVPTESELKQTLALVGADRLQVNTDETTGETMLSMEDGMQIDLGGIAKGYTSGRVMDIFREYGITSAMINLGGNVFVLGDKTDGTKWKVGIQDPEDEAASLGGIAISNKAVITSGGYERYFEDENTGVRYHHIIDPKTGYSANNGLISVTIISEDGTLADALSTSLFVMGTEEAVAYCEAHCENDGFDVIMETESGELYITDDLEEDFIDINGNTSLNIIMTQ